MFTKIREFLIRALGGYTDEPKMLCELCQPMQQYQQAQTISAYNIVAGVPDEDDLAYSHMQIARKLGERLLDCELIDFNNTETFTDGYAYTVIMGQVKIVKCAPKHM